MKKDRLNIRYYKNTDDKYAHIPVTGKTFPFVGNNDIIVDREGKYITINGDRVVPYKKGDYYSVNIPDKGNVQFHRLMALAWLGLPPRSPEKWLVNHIDGNKLNNHIDNLEWASFSDNILHAYKTGLRYDNRVIWMKDLITNEEKEFYSLQECARYIGINGGVLYIYLKDKSKIRKGRYIFKEKGEEYPEITPEQLEEAQDRKDSLPIKVTNTKTGEVTYYRSTAEAALSLGINKATIRRRRKGITKGGHFNSACKDLVFEKVTDPELIEKYRGEHPCKHNAPKRKPRNIEVYDCKTGETTYWKSIGHFEKYVGAPRHGIRRSVAVDGFWEHYKIKYIGQKPRVDVEKRKRAYYAEKFKSVNNA